MRWCRRQLTHILNGVPLTTFPIWWKKRFSSLLCDDLFQAGGNSAHIMAISEIREWFLKVTLSVNLDSRCPPVSNTNDFCSFFYFSMRQKIVSEMDIVFWLTFLPTSYLLLQLESFSWNVLNDVKYFPSSWQPNFTSMFAHICNVDTVLDIWFSSSIFSRIASPDSAITYFWNWIQSSHWGVAETCFGPLISFPLSYSSHDYLSTTCTLQFIHLSCLESCHENLDNALAFQLPKLLFAVPFKSYKFSWRVPQTELRTRKPTVSLASIS